MKLFRALRKLLAANILPLAACAAILLLGAVLGIVLYNNTFGDAFFSIIALYYLIRFFLLLVLVAVIQALLWRKIARWFGLSIAILCACMLAIFIFMKVGDYLVARGIDAVERYVAHAVPILDGIKSQTGSYPSTLPVSLLGKPPEFLAKYGKYSSDGKTFLFEYEDEPADCVIGPGPSRYDSADRQWKYDQ